MKLLLKSLSVLTLLIIMTISVSAQRSERSMNPDEKIERQTQRMVDDLGLDESQATRIRQINTTYAEKMAKMRESSTVNGERSKGAMHDDMMPLREAQEAELMRVLTPEQSKKYESMKMDRENKRNKAGMSKKSSGQNGIQMEKKDN